MNKLVLFIITAILTISGSAMADVKIKTKQTMSGQTSENTSFIKGKRQRTEMMGGMMVSITQCDLSRDLQLNPQTKTYMVNLYDDGTQSPAGTPTANTGSSAPVQTGGVMYVTTTIKDTGERKQMFGYTARHIIQTIETETSPDACAPSKTKMEMDMWVIDAEFNLACTQTRSYRPYNGGKAAACTDRIQQKTIGTAKSGYPVYQKMTTYDASGKESYTMVNEVVEISKATLDMGLFEAPADYREVKDAAAMYSSASASTSGVNYNGGTGNIDQTGGQSANTNPSLPSSSGSFGSNLKGAAAPRSETTDGVGAKQPGTVRVGLATVKTGSVGEGVSAADLSIAVQNSLQDFIKGTKVEIVLLDARLASAQAEEAKQKECDFVVYASVSHKKGGGGGFGFGKMLAQTVAQTGIGHTGSVVGNLAGQMATTAIVTAGSMSGNVKKKDEITLDIKAVSTADNSAAIARQFKAKASSDGDDIISTVVEQAAQAIVDTLGR